MQLYRLVLKGQEKQRKKEKEKKKSPPRHNNTKGIMHSYGGPSHIRPASSISMRSNSVSLRSSTPNPLGGRRVSGAFASSLGVSRPASSLGSKYGRSGSSLGGGILAGNPRNSENVYIGKIFVSVRPKPHDNQRTSWVVNSEEKTIFNAELGDFTFDSVFDVDNITNQSVYATSVSEVVKQTMNGFNGTVFAYGMTGSGKTHSMQGTYNDPGIIPLAVNDIFKYINEDSNSMKQYSVKVSYLEIYNEKIYDLLNPREAHNLSFNSSPQKELDLKIRDDPITGVKVAGLSEEIVRNEHELLSVIERGDTLRKTGSTDFNSRSSRSHAVVLIRITIKLPKNEMETVSTLSLCDLAGSERATTQSDRRQEGAFINKSLLALSTVISRLSGAGKNNNLLVGHIPYRDSKLTRLLQPALSGKSIISILCTIHLGENTYTETVNTLRFAAKAKNINLNVSKHEIFEGNGAEKDKLIDKLQNTVQKQKIEIDLLKASNGLNSLSLEEGNFSLQTKKSTLNLNEDVSKLKIQNAQLQSENRLLTERIEHLVRLTNERRTESIILKNDIMNTLTSTNKFLNDPTIIKNMEELFKRQTLEIEEYNSYIQHLENEIGKFETKNYLENDSSPSKTFQKSKNSKHNENRLEVKELKLVIQDQKDEIENLRDVISDKDKIIKAFTTTKKLRNSLV